MKLKNKINGFRKNKGLGILLMCIVYASCKTPAFVPNSNAKSMPQSYSNAKDSSNSAEIKWKDFFTDKNLAALIDTALKNNLDLLVALQDIEIAKNNVLLRKGLLFPNANFAGTTSLEKTGDYTSQGAGDRSADIIPGQIVPTNLSNYFFRFEASWEADVWGKLRSAKKAALTRYLSSIEGRNFVITNLVAEVANTYYELLALDNQLEIIRTTIQLQKNALEIVKVQKEASVVTDLAVKQFEAQVFGSQSMEFDVLQQITENENKINFLLGRFPQPIIRDKTSFTDQIPAQIKTGIPSQLLKNRPDIKQAEFELFATKCDVFAARAEFYPSLNITGLLGFQGFKPSYLFMTPQSLAYSIVGNLVAPLINRSAIKAQFNTAKAYQIQAMFNYQKTILNGYVEVSNQLSSINNLEQEYRLKTKQVEALTKSVDISNDLFSSARATYLEVLFAQRDALESKLELVDAKKQQYNAMVNLYKALGGGWR